MKKQTAYNEWEERQKKELDFWSSREGLELQLNSVAQGYEDRLFGIMMVLFGSGFIAAKVIKNARKEVK